MVRALLLIFMLSTPLVTSAEKIKFIYTYEDRQISQIIDEFERQTGIEVERRWTQQSDLKVSLIEMMEMGIAPDVVMVPGDHVGLYKPMQYSAISPELLEHPISENLWQSARSDGQLYGVPIIQGNQLMLFYNKALVAKPAASWDEIRSQRTAFLNQTSEHEFLAWNVDEMYFFVPFLGAFGGWPLTEGKLSLNSAAMASALDFYRQLLKEELPKANCDYACSFSLFKNGKLAYTINGDWALNEFHDALGMDLGISSLPSIDDFRPARPMFSTHVLAFPEDSLNGDKRHALIQFTNFLQNPDTQLKFWRQLQALPVEPNAYQEALSTAENHNKHMIQTLENALPMPADAAMTFAWSAMRKGYLRHKTGVMNGQEAAELMQSLAEKQLGKY